jgi:hypothetical protein
MDKRPPKFSEEQWARLGDEHKLRFWEGWIAGLNFALEHVKPDSLSALSAEIASAEEALNAVRGQ